MNTEDPTSDDQLEPTPDVARRRVAQIRDVLGGPTDAEFAEIIGVDPATLEARLIASGRLPVDGWEPGPNNMRRRVDRLREELGMLVESEVAGILGIEPRTLQARRLAGANAPPAIRIGKHLVYMLADVERWLREQAKPNDQPMMRTQGRRTKVSA